MPKQNFAVLVGKTIMAVTRLDGVDCEEERLQFHTSDGIIYTMGHRQDCCEHVSLIDEIGHWDDIVGSPVLLAETYGSDDEPLRPTESFTWTFYELATLRGFMTLRWYGTSSGYYSARVDFWEGDSYY